MSIDSSLKTHGALSGHRNVLTRAERVARLLKQGKLDRETSDPIGLPKVGVQKIRAKKKK